MRASTLLDECVVDRAGAVDKGADSKHYDQVERARTVEAAFVRFRLQSACP
jgi:hypothetical protein